jgi:UDP-N-acetylmuramate--alanine ligase
MNILTAKKIYCIGIGGIGVSALARLSHARGVNVSGSDLRESAVTKSLEEAGIKVIIGQNEKNIREFAPDTVIYSEDVSESSAGFVELQYAKSSGITVLTQAEALGGLMEGKFGIGVTGTNGKSTTTILLGLILQEANLDPTVLAGTMLSPKNETAKFQANTRVGESEYMVVEADEYRAKMLKGHPKIAVVTNIAEDHLDFYKDLNDIRSAFSKYILGLPADGVVVYNADDHNAVEVCRHATCHKVTFGIKHYADLQAVNIRQGDGQQTFDLHLHDRNIGTFEFKVPGEFNIYNALGAAAVAIKIGVSVEAIQKALSSFVLPWRRFEVVGQLGKAVVVSDYAHHPAGVTATIKAAQEFYPGKKILTVFQPHHRNRTKKLFKEFVESMLGAQTVIVPEIFDVAGREHGETVSSRDIVEELKKQGEDAYYTEDLQKAGELITNMASQFDVIIMMGAGDIDGLARKLVESK